MEKPASVNRVLIRMSTYPGHVLADFAFSADFRSTNLTLAVNLSVRADKAASFRDIEQMADYQFIDVLKATLAKGLEGISSP